MYSSAFLSPFFASKRHNLRMRQDMPQIEVHDRRVEKETVQEIKYAPDTRKKMSGILHPGLAFEQGFDEVEEG